MVPELTAAKAVLDAADAFRAVLQTNRDAILALLAAETAKKDPMGYFDNTADHVRQFSQVVLYAARNAERKQS